MCTVKAMVFTCAWPMGSSVTCTNFGGTGACMAREKQSRRRKVETMDPDDCLLRLMTELAKEEPSRTEVEILLQLLDVWIDGDGALPTVHALASPGSFEVGS